MIWNDLISEYFKTPDGQVLAANFRKAKETATISPNPELVFRAYSENICRFEDLKIIILGDEPCADPAIADGLCLSSKKPDYLLPETRTWYNWMRKHCFPAVPLEIFKDQFLSSSMVHIARQGVLFANKRLTTYSGRPGSHHDLGWERFTQWIIERIIEEKTLGNKPLMIVSLDVDKISTPYDHKKSIYINIDNPKLGAKPLEISKTTSQIFIAMSNFICQYYPESAKTYQCDISEAFNFDLIETLWGRFVQENNIPMPAFTESVSQVMREAVMKFSNKFGVEGAMGELSVPSLVFKVGLNYKIN
jgi:uracil-DNA glycosylase